MCWDRDMKWWERFGVGLRCKLVNLTFREEIESLKSCARERFHNLKLLNLSFLPPLPLESTFFIDPLPLNCCTFPQSYTHIGAAHTHGFLPAANKSRQSSTFATFCHLITTRHAEGLPLSQKKATHNSKIMTFYEQATSARNIRHHFYDLLWVLSIFIVSW